MERLPTLDKRSVLVRAGAGFTGLLALAVVGKLAVDAMVAGFALLALLGTALAGMAVFKLLPYLAQKLDNTTWSLQKSEARKNPVEQLENDLVASVARAQAFKNEIMEDRVRVNDFRQKLEELKADKPKMDFGALEAQLAQATKLLQKKIQMYNKSAKEIQQSRDDLEIYKTQFELSGMQLVSGTSVNEAEEEEKRRMLRSEAIDAISSRLSHSMASLELDEHSLLEDADTETPANERPKALPESTANGFGSFDLVDLDNERSRK